MFLTSLKKSKFSQITKLLYFLSQAILLISVIFLKSEYFLFLYKWMIIIVLKFYETISTPTKVIIRKKPTDLLVLSYRHFKWGLLNIFDRNCFCNLYLQLIGSENVLKNKEWWILMMKKSDVYWLDWYDLTSKLLYYVLLSWLSFYLINP